jgi:hypothetical protein
MSWIKRNLYFVIGGAVALMLMGLAGFYLYSKWHRNNEVMQKLEADFAELQRLNSENPHPGSGSVDNIAKAQEQQRQLREFGGKLRKFFDPIPPIPQTPEFPKVSDRDFSAALSRTIDQLERAANSTSVTLPPAYSFSFEAQRPRVTFAVASTPFLAVQLGEIKAIADVLIGAKVNSIDNIRRERVSTDDMTGQMTDYLEEKSVTNELAVLTPYEVTFRCFSSELAGVLGGFAASPHAIMVESLNVEPASGTNTLMNPEMAMYGGPGYPMPGAAGSLAAGNEFARRYGGLRGGPEGMGMGMGMGPGGGRMGGGNLGGGALGGGSLGGAAGGAGGVQYRPIAPGAPTVRPPQPMQPAYGAAAGAGARTPALQTVMDEKQLKVTMSLTVIKPTPPTTRK